MKLRLVKGVERTNVHWRCCANAYRCGGVRYRVVSFVVKLVVNRGVHGRPQRRTHDANRGSWNQHRFTALEKDYVFERGRDATCFGVRLFHRLDDARRTKIFVVACYDENQAPSLRTPAKKGGVLGFPDAAEITGEKQDGCDRCQHVSIVRPWVVVDVKVAGVLKFHVLLKVVIL